MRGPIDVILNAVRSTKGREHSAGFEKISNDVVEGSEGRVSLGYNGIDEIREFGVLRLFTKIG